LFVGFGVGAGLFLCHVLGLWIVGGHQCTLAVEWRLLKEGEILACLIDTGSYQEGVAALVGQSRFHAEIKDDIVHDAIHP